MVTIQRVCKVVGFSRANYYKQRNVRQEKAIQGDKIISHVRQVRCQHPRMGGRKLLHFLDAILAAEDIQIGRDRFFNLLRSNNLLVPKLRRKRRTTYVDKSLPLRQNLIKDLVVTRANQVWVSDITYIPVGDYFVYLSLITDVYSRKIVGWHVHPTLSTEGCLEALKMALKTVRPGEKVIHHSDRGCQYASHEYAEALERAGITISMTEEQHCYENGLAERVNGILKLEYGLEFNQRTYENCVKNVKQAIEFYNTQRPHQSLSYRTPSEVYEESRNQPDAVSLSV